jgi:predicted nucleotide-binding protein
MNVPPPWEDGAAVRLAESSDPRHILRMPSKFNGDLQALKDQLLAGGIDGEWHERPNRVWQLKLPDGVGVNWSETRGTLWCDGRSGLKDAREKQIAEILGTPFQAPQGANRPAMVAASRKVFVVYGHDQKARTELEAMLRRWELEPLILDQLTSGGQTIIEKLESVRREANFAVVLATPDDEGHRRDHPDEKAYRARQNVVLELGMMLAILGRRKVAVLLRTSVEMERPSDIQGLIYVTFKDDVKEAALTLAKEINAQGIPINLDRV